MDYFGLVYIGNLIEFKFLLIKGHKFILYIYLERIAATLLTKNVCKRKTEQH